MMPLSPLPDDPEYVGIVPQIIEDDDDDRLLSSTTFEFFTPKPVLYSEALDTYVTQNQDEHKDPQEEEDQLLTPIRRSSRVRKAPEYFSSVVESPTVNFKRRRDPVYENSIKKLLQEKEQRAKIGFTLEPLENIKFNDDITEHSLQFDRDQILNNILSNEQNEQLRQALSESFRDFQEKTYLFFEERNNDCHNLSYLLRIPRDSELKKRMKDDSYLKLIYDCSEAEEGRKMLLCGGWIERLWKTKWEPPAPVLRWLLNLVCFEVDKNLVLSAFELLREYFATSWAKSAFFVQIDQIVLILRKFGAMEDSLKQEVLLRDVVEKNLEKRTLPNLLNFKLFIRLLGDSVASRRAYYSLESIRYLIIILLRCSLDRCVLEVLFDIEVALKLILDAFSQGEWNMQMISISQRLLSSCRHSPCLVAKMLKALSPVHPRSQALRSLVAYQFLVPNERGSISMNKDEAVQKISLLPLVELLSSLNSPFHIDEKTNYEDIYWHAVLLGYVLFSKEVLDSDKESAKKIITRLRQIHDRIQDGRATFLDRSKAKEIIQRLFMRLFYTTGQSYQAKGLKQQKIPWGTSPGTLKQMNDSGARTEEETTVSDAISEDIERDGL
ncbi:uncharacterized protein VTP21DRAFT_7276 [Calcarisporiella thermophila]|uniref:uncharacterized protein n=1 Tax=Calcarisporiella thermophila TaxID=911321 RepID=UPI0037430C83